MQQKWDSIDKMLSSSNEEFTIGDDYNQRLLSKIRGEKSPIGRNLVSALSLIAAGLLLITIYTTDIRYRMIDLRLHISYELTSLENIIRTNNNLFGE